MQINLSHIYSKTNLGSLIFEPLVIFTSLVLLGIIFYWGIKIRKHPSNHRFLEYILLVLFIGVFSGALFNLTQEINFFLILLGSILLTGLSVSFYFFRKIKIRKYLILSVLSIPFLLISFLYFYGIEKIELLKLSYIFIALLIIFPAFHYIRKIKSRNWALILCSSISFIFFLFLRIYDFQSSFSTFSQWLGNLFGAVCIYLLISYLYEDKIRR